jgi:hypothetical protein
MLVTDLKYMESIVSSRKDLDWDGWNVVQDTKSPGAMFKKDGVFKNGIWFKRVIFPITESGWNIPNKIGTKNEQLEG